jgi:glycosyltransferase involved in cell wall biosynthesis
MKTEEMLDNERTACCLLPAAYSALPAAYSAQPAAYSPLPTASPAACRVLHVINGEDYAGAERVQDSLALRLPEFGFEVGFACLKPRRFAQMRQATSAPVYELPMRSKFDWSPARRLAQLVRGEGYSIIHSHTPRTAIIGRAAAALARVPLVHHVHCQTAVEVGGRRWQDKLNLLLERIATYRAARVIAVSPSLRRYLLRHGYSQREVRLVTNGVPTRGETPAPRPARTLGAIALFRPRKGLETLIEALAIMRRAGFDVRLRAVGRFQSPDYECEIRRLAARLEVESAIDWAGFQQDIGAELARMDVFVLPSLVSEAMPMSVLEAMSAGVLVVGTAVDGITDLIDDGVDGLLARPGDARHLADTLKRAMSDDAERHQLALAGYRKQIDCYSDLGMALGVAEIYEEVLGR